MKWPFRRRPGGNGDVIYEIKRLCFLWCPHWGIFFKVYANAASPRNKLSCDLNKLAEKVQDKLHEYARAEADLEAEKKDMKNHGYNYLGISEVDYIEKKRLKGMLPYVSEPENRWESVFNKVLVKKILHEHGAKPKDGGNNTKGKTKGRLILTPSDAAESHPEHFDGDHAEHVMKWRAHSNKEKKNSSGDKSPQNKSKKGGWITMRSEIPQGDMSWNEWDNACRELWESRKSDD